MFRNHAEGQWKDAGGRGTVAVPAGGLVEVGLVECNHKPVSKLVKASRIAFLTKQRREARHQAEQMVVVGCAKHGALGLAGRIVGMDQFGRFRRDAPIAVDISRHEIVFEVNLHVSDPLLHSLIVPFDHSQIAVLIVKVVGDNDEAGGPGDIVIAKGPVGWGHIADAPIRIL